MAHPSKFYKGNANIPSGNTEYEWTQEMVEATARSRQDIQYFAENFFYIVTLDEGKRKIALYDAQKRILDSLVDHVRVCLLASRQVGKTTMMTIYALWVSCFQEDKRVMILANKEKTAIQIFSRIRLAYELLPNWIKPGIDGEYGKTGMKLSNGSSIACAATSGTSIRGDTANCLILDELAFVPQQVVEEFWNSVMPIISSSKDDKAQIFVVSTPNGTQNKFYEIYSGGERNENGWQSERIDWWEVPGRDEAWKIKMIQTLGEKEKFDQEFGNKFIEVGQSPFQKEIFDRMRLEQFDPIMMFADHMHGFDPVITMTGTVSYKVWLEPDDTHVYSIGVDVGEGVGRAGSVISVIDITDLTNIKLAAQYHSRWIQPVPFAGKILKVAAMYGNPWVLCERNNMGGQVIDELHGRLHYPRLVNYDPTNAKMKYYTRLGVYSHTNSKYKGVTNMRYWFDALQVVHIYDIATIQEYETFIRHPNGTWGKMKTDNIFDDRVDSITWALFILEPDICEQYLQVHEYDERMRPRRISDAGSSFNAGDFHSQFASIGARQTHQPLPTFIGSGVQGSMLDGEMQHMQDEGWSVSYPNEVNNQHNGPQTTPFL